MKSISDMEKKKRMLTPVRKRRKFYEERPEKVYETIRAGTERIRGVAKGNKGCYENRLYMY